jgi:hypothetical protein
MNTPGETLDVFQMKKDSQLRAGDRRILTVRQWLFWHLPPRLFLIEVSCSTGFVSG